MLLSEILYSHIMDEVNSDIRVFVSPHEKLTFIVLTNRNLKRKNRVY